MRILRNFHIDAHMDMLRSDGDFATLLRLGEEVAPGGSLGEERPLALEEVEDRDRLAVLEDVEVWRAGSGMAGPFLGARRGGTVLGGVEDGAGFVSVGLHGAIINGAVSASLCLQYVFLDVCRSGNLVMLEASSSWMAGSLKVDEIEQNIKLPCQTNYVHLLPRLLGTSYRKKV